MIDRFHISNFKSLVDFDLSLPKFAVLIGMNGAGKTTVLQAFDLLSQMMVGNMGDWLEARSWSAHDLNSKLIAASNIKLGVRLRGTRHAIMWGANFNRKELACLNELAKVPVDNEWETVFRLHNRHYRLDDRPNQPVAFSYTGSLLSQLRDGELSAPLKELRDALRRIRSLELLAPHRMRQRSRGEADDVGMGGERLSAYIATIKGEEKAALIALLRDFYPNVVDIKASPTKGGWKRLSMTENFNGKLIESEARHINDGLLRILAMLAQTMAEQSTLLFDEVENGVNPEIVEKLVKLLVNAKQQIIVTTHSPMILNYLSDDVAREAVFFVYKTPDGHTRARRFFDLPGVGRKLDVMGAGEAFVDTDLVTLTEKCVALDEADALAVSEPVEKQAKVAA
jgi:predicted ATP-dependent endonuclease of OLD family